MKKSYPLASFSLVYVFLLKLFLKKENNVNYFSFLLVKISDKSTPPPLPLAPTFNCCESVHVWYSYHMKKLGWKFNISVKTCALRLLTKHNYLLLFFVLFGMCNISARFLLPTSHGIETLEFLLHLTETLHLPGRCRLSCLLDSVPFLYLRF